MVREERLRVDQIEEEKSIAMLQNELLTEMVAAEQVTFMALIYFDQQRRHNGFRHHRVRCTCPREMLKCCLVAIEMGTRW